MQNMTRISIPMTVDEREALRTLALRELRDPREHVRYLLQKELAQQGILPTNANGAGVRQDQTSTVCAV